MIDLRLASPATPPRRSEPVSLGVPLPKGRIRDVRALALDDPAGRRLPLQTSVLDTWSDGSLRWVLLDFTVDAGGAEGVVARVVDSGGATAPPATGGITVGEDATAITVDTGAVRVRLARDGFLRVLDAVTPAGPLPCRPLSGLSVTAADGRIWPIAVSGSTIEVAGPVRARVTFAGTTGDADSTLDLVARLDFWAGLPTCRISLTIANPAAAAHPGGYWELGDPASVLLEDVTFRLALEDGQPRTFAVSAIAGETLAPRSGPIVIYQDSSGGARWQSSNHVTRDGSLGVRFKGFELRSGSEVIRGDRATPVGSVASDSWQLGMTSPRFWQTFPKRLEVAADGLSFGLLPGESRAAHEIQAGERFAHTWFVAFGRDPVTATPLDWCRDPLLLAASPSWYADCEALPHLAPATDDPHAAYRALVDAALDPEHGFAAKREVIDEYGWRNFGDWYGDHEAARSPGPLISHYNNQYDGIAGCGAQFFMTGDGRWRGLMQELADHVVDIDIYHTTRDKSAYNGGLFWHTFHYVDAGQASHRTYPNAAGVNGGGPSAEHNYSTGLMLEYFLTGETRFRDAVIQLARWVLDMDDGSRTVFRWLAAGDTGYASATGTPDYHGPGRGPANCILTLLNAHRLTGDGRYLRKAEQLIRRCIHPHDDLDARNLLDAERRWYYTVFLQALGRYLEARAEAGDLGDTYAWARASLLHYARWMASHERPYLDRPEILEYPTETWVAQDMRKAEVFSYARLHATDDDRARFAERADFFFGYVTRTLTAMPTRTFARPVVLMLSYGFMHAWQQRHPEMRAAAPAGHPDFGRPRTFVPQRQRAMRRAVALAAGAAVVGLSVVAAGLHWLIG